MAEMSPDIIVIIYMIHHWLKLCYAAHNYAFTTISIWEMDNIINVNLENLWAPTPREPVNGITGTGPGPV